MVSKLVTLSLLAALASNVNAYYWHVETVFGHAGGAYIDYKIHPVDIQFPENNAVVDKGGFPLNEPANLSLTLGYSAYGYEDINMSFDLEKEELIALRAMDGQKEKATFPCVQMDEVLEKGDYWETVKRKVYSCGNPAYYGIKGKPKPITTTRAVPTTTTTVAVTTTTTPPPAVVTTTTTNVVTTTNVPTTTTIVTSVATEPITTTTTTTLAPQPTPTCLAGYRGKRNGKGPNGACCSHSDDCKDTCVKGVCGVHP
ncbi:MAG: hypothetical protein J3Q66DRAFT_388487 [Benniella sp.]|nr:MAG: hypothetical protein J3Q66DRAFT_388487 [Benniella sp.]